VGGCARNLIIFGLCRVYLQNGLLILISLYICGFPLHYDAFTKPDNPTPFFFQPLNACVSCAGRGRHIMEVG
jgi:hypothetical protein